MLTVKHYESVSDERAQSVLKLVQGMAKSGNIKRGVNEVAKCLNKGISLLVIIANDVEPPELTAFLPITCEDKGVSFIHVPSKSALGVACGIQRPIAACTVYCPKDMEAKRLVDKINDILK